MKEILESMVAQAIEAARAAGALVTEEVPPIDIDAPAKKEFGDYSSNLAMLLAKSERKAPLIIAECIKEHMSARADVIDEIRVEKPGFLNFYLKTDYLASGLGAVMSAADEYGKSDLGAGSKVLLEFVSANPTGPLHVGHGRGAAVGDALGRILSATGHDVHREYYVNDAGNQMEMLGASTLIRYRQSKGEDVEFPDNLYSGEYIKEIAESKPYQEALAGKEGVDATQASIAFTSKLILETIKGDLESFRVGFDEWFSEKSLFAGGDPTELTGKVGEAIQALESAGHIFEDKGAKWLKSSAHGDEKDRVVVREDGRPTYLASDIAYHHLKFNRGFDQCINIWGADHHGYLPRVRASLEMLEHDPERLKVLFVQFVSLRRGGEPVQMSTRAGQFEELSKVVEEVGVDAARFFFMLRSPDSALEFDLDLAMEQSSENPVFYVQYAHARTCSLFHQATERGITFNTEGGITPGGLSLPEEHVLAKTLLEWPEIVEVAARRLEPHRISFYLLSLAKDFHAYYNRHRVLEQAPEVTMARLYLIRCMQIVLKNGLALLGVSAPDKM
ncbi:MAG: arginine--tRNA ligase [Nitrospinaceae bacterium]|nr:arginine--tRNA ligase [Nitrospinaceae bacterium]MBT3821898.1 arginine--tRNA ligase [Nitrospinaceae bacterium]MBT4431850.1 arginine--tRNA ligase [Nitrospinaceae bacterium]MBT5947067.1 arginine--tRNA ligase [Nitrospinaceae bacterium]MBT6394560.1 arginine--tRNA ligase [Nitrospinaceae bacterium]